MQLSPPGLAGPAGYGFCWCFLFQRFLSDQLSQHLPADLRQICSIGKTMAVDDQPEIGV